MGAWHVLTEASGSRTLAWGVAPNFAYNKPLPQSAIPWRFVTASLYEGQLAAGSIHWHVKTTLTSGTNSGNSTPWGILLAGRNASRVSVLGRVDTSTMR